MEYVEDVLNGRLILYQSVCNWKPELSCRADA